MDSSATSKLIEQYGQILAGRRERFSSDAVFGGAKYVFEKALLDEIARVREPLRAEALQTMFIQLASFVPQKDYDLIEHCRQRGEQEVEYQQVLDLISAGDHPTIQTELEARGIPELVRYYALYRRVLLETEARRRQAASVEELNTDS